MAINYGSIGDDKPKPPKKGKKSPKKDEIEIKDEQLTPSALEQHLGRLAYQKRARSVAVRAATELLERKAPKTKNPEERLTAGEARRICDVYDAIFSETTCPKCGHACSKGNLQ